MKAARGASGLFPSGSRPRGDVRPGTVFVRGARCAREKLGVADERHRSKESTRISKIASFNYLNEVHALRVPIIPILSDKYLAVTPR